jgi:beta-phosphoglucomutase
VTIRAVVFDFDGVLANSEPLHYAAFRDVLADQGMSLSEADYYARYLGYDDRGVFEAVLPPAADRGPRIAQLIEKKAVRLELLERDRPVLFPGAADAVMRMAASRPIAIASGALRPEIERVLRSAGLIHLFATIVGAEDTPASKPSPDPYLRAVSLLAARLEQELQPEACLAVEDSHWGLESARRAGLRTVGISHTYPASELQADLVIDHLDLLTDDLLRRL